MKNKIFDLWRTRLFICTTAVGILLFSRVNSWSGTLIVPPELANADGNAVGFFQGPSQRVQQVYSASYFAGISSPIEISAIRFRVDPSVSQAFSASPELELRVSTTTQGADRLSTSFAANTGNDEVIAVPRSQITWSGSPGLSFDAVIPFPNHFQYDRSKGNLLLDFNIFNLGGSTGFDVQLKDNDGLSILGSTAIPGVGQPDSAAFVTAFSYIVVPEPSEYALLLSGIVIAIKRRRRVTS